MATDLISFFNHLPHNNKLFKIMHIDWTGFLKLLEYNTVLSNLKPLEIRWWESQKKTFTNLTCSLFLGEFRQEESAIFPKYVRRLTSKITWLASIIEHDWQKSANTCIPKYLHFSLVCKRKISNVSFA